MPEAIGMLVPEYPPPFKTGRSSYVYSLAHLLNGIGRTIVVFAGAEQQVPSANCGNITTCFVPTVQSGGEFDLSGWNEALVERVDEFQKKTAWTFTLIHCHDCDTFPSALMLRQRLGIPIVSTVHFLAEPFDRRLGQTPPDHLIQREREICTRSDALITVSQTLKQAIVEMHNIPDNRIAVVYPSFDPSIFLGVKSHSPELEERRRRFAPKSESVVVFAGRFSPVKGISAFLRSAIHILAEGHRAVYIIAGEIDRGVYPDRCIALAENHPVLKGRVFFVGHQSREELAELYGLATIAVVPSLFETFGYAATEAMAAGVPTIATNVGGLREIIQSERSGLLVPLQHLGEGLYDVDVPRLVQAQRRLLTDPELRKRLGAGGRARVLERFPYQDMLRRTLEVYEAVVKSRTPGLASDLSSDVDLTPTSLGPRVN
jgi:starch synthase